MSSMLAIYRVTPVPIPVGHDVAESCFERVEAVRDRAVEEWVPREEVVVGLDDSDDRLLRFPGPCNLEEGAYEWLGDGITTVTYQLEVGEKDVSRSHHCVVSKEDVLVGDVRGDTSIGGRASFILCKGREWKDAVVLRVGSRFLSPSLKVVVVSVDRSGQVDLHGFFLLIALSTNFSICFCCSDQSAAV